MAKGFRIELGVLGLLLGAASVCAAADSGAVVSGIVRDARGKPQMGALVQIVTADATVRATVFTDIQGRYLIQRVLPGLYGVRASAALFMPASRSNLHLQPNRRAIVNLTLSGLLDEFAWLPAQAKAADEARDDWSWTLRSPASRPILKVADDGISERGHNRDGSAPRPSIFSRAALTSGSKNFGDSASRVSVRAARTEVNGSVIAISASTGVASPASSEHPESLSTVVERRMASGGLLASRVEYQSHPEVLLGAGSAGLHVVTISSAEKFAVGDLAEIEAGNRLQVVSGAASVVASRPFLRVSAHAGPGLAVTYNLATARDNSDYDSAIWRDAVLPRAGFEGGRIGLEDGLHQEIAISRSTPATVLAVAYYADALDLMSVAGGGGEARRLPAASAQDSSLAPANLLIDQGNGSFQLLTKGYRSSGVNVLLTRAVGRAAWITLQYSTGSAMTVADAQASKLAGDVPALHARRAQSATVSARASFARTGTKVRTSYRWQPDVLVSSVDPYDVLAGGDYLSVHLRQPLNLPGVLPGGVELTVDGTNMLAQGYQRFIGRDGRPLYLAASPASLRAGLAFNF